MKRKALIFCTVVFFALLFNACSQPIDYVVVLNSSSMFDNESEFIKSLFLEADFDNNKLKINTENDNENNSENGGNYRSAFFISFSAIWEHEADENDLIISRTIFVPRADVLEGRMNTTLKACLDDKETLIKIDELAPPFIALRVDDLAVGDEGYPLVKLVKANIVTDKERLFDSKLSAKFNFLEKIISDAPKPLIQQVPEPLWITVGGDTMLGRGASELLFEEGPVSIFGETAEMLALSDIAILNLEGVISSRGERVPKSFNFRFVPEVAAALRNAGIDAVLHANNHVFDYGEEAFLDSLSWLSKAGIGVVGAGINDEAASDPFIFTKGNQTCRVFGIASFPRENNGWDGETAAAGPNRAGMLHARRGGIEKLKQKFSHDSLNVVLFHGGVEWSTKPDAATRELYTDLIASGADLIIGTHPHVVQGFEWVHGKPVFWSLGNYVFGLMNGFYTGDEGLFIRLGFWQGKLLYMEPFPIFLNNIRTNIVSRDKLKTFYERSRELLLDSGFF